MTESRVDIDVALRRLAAELSDLETTGESVEAAIGRVGVQDGSELPLELQQIDRLVQRLRDMARCADALAQHFPATDIELSVLLHSMKLEQSRAALSGVARPADQGGESTFF